MSRPDYNSRLFSSGIRGWAHSSRFRWLARTLSRLKVTPSRVLELGCFDGKTIDFLPTKPECYQGYDANWEGGLEIGRKRFANDANVILSECQTPDQMTDAEVPFDTTICMETFEHIPDALVEPYLKRLADLTTGHLFITVPNERGSIFVAKYFAKKCIGQKGYKYTLKEFLNAAIGRLHCVERNEHKGFDYKRLVRQVSKYFDVEKVSGAPMHWLPASMNMTICIRAKSKESVNQNNVVGNPSTALNSAA